MATKSEWYTNTRYPGESFDIHTRDAENLGFILTHPDGVVTANGRQFSSYRPLVTRFYMGHLSSADYRKCDVCGADHEALVIAFMDWKKKTDAPYIVKLSEEKVEQWAQEGFDRDLAAMIRDKGLSRETIIEKLGLNETEPEARVEATTAQKPAQKPADAQNDVDALRAAWRQQEERFNGEPALAGASAKGGLSNEE